MGNGKSTRFWTDNWTTLGNLRDFLNLSSTSALGIPAPRTEPQLALHAYLTTVTLTDEEDSFVWKQANKSSDRYSTGFTYSLIRTHAPLVPWMKAVWPSQGIPKQSFLTWLVTLNRCPTKDRIISWGLQTNPTCILCNTSNETRDHLFFDCSYSAVIWEALARKTNCRSFTSWDQSLLHMSHRTGTKSERLLGILAWQTSIYFIWTERNGRIHRQNFRAATSIIKTASALIKNKISSFRDRSSKLCSAMLQSWMSN